ncbi:MAG: hypothetical protein RR361_00110 [Anaerovorax sp.]
MAQNLLYMKVRNVCLAMMGIFIAKVSISVCWCLILTLVPLAIIFANAGFTAIKMIKIVI